jgi:hypothetical protein
MRSLKARERLPQFIRLIAFLGVALSGLATYLLVASVADRHASSATVPDPEVVALTDHPGARASYSIEYSSGSFTSPGQSSLEAGGEPTPVGVRELDLTFHVRSGTRQLRYALLLNSDASVYHATAAEGFGNLEATSPGSALSSPCPSIASFHTAQVLSGVVPVDAAGEAQVKVLGGIRRTVHYPEADERVRVSVLTLLPPTGDAPGPSTETRCTVALPEWEQIGGRTWFTPTLGTGYVNVGQVPAGDIVESANPPVANPAKLAWVLHGPSSVSYTLLDTSQQNDDTFRLTLAGITAALAASILVALIAPFLQSSATAPEPDVANTDAVPAREVSIVSSPPKATARIFALGVTLGAAVTAAWRARRRRRP